MVGTVKLIYDIHQVECIAGVPERPKGEDLRSSGVGLRGFESLPLHFILFMDQLQTNFKY